jgi:anti-sigma28 factor (negative regulator of flagellin synthesis)
MNVANRGRTRDNQPVQPGQETVTRLREQIATRTYRVDSRAVAREMLFKIRVMTQLRDQRAPFEGRRG